MDNNSVATPNDLEILEVNEQARGAFDNNQAKKFTPAIRELEGLGY